MANVKKCDVCGVIYDPPMVRRLFVTRNDLFFGPTELDLCPGCNEKLEEFLNTSKENNDESISE